MSVLLVECIHGSFESVGNTNLRVDFVVGFFCIPSQVYEGSTEFSQRGRERLGVGLVGTSSSVNHVVTN
jgi:hypothetical protein